ncbi:MAG: hypothetical protein ABI672_12635 [Vicinamibacteria bacterium]
MNPLKNLFSKVFESTTPPDAKTEVSKENGAFEWNPEEESVAATSAQGSSWKRGNTPDDVRPAGLAPDREVAPATNELPTPTFAKNVAPPPVASPGHAPSAMPLWNEPAAAPTLAAEASSPAHPPTPTPPPVPSIPMARVEPVAAQPAWITPSVSDQGVALVPAPIAPAMVPLSDFEDVYRKAGIKSPVHGYGVERVYRLLTSRRLTGLDRSIRRSALLTALDAAGVPVSDVSQDAVLRRKALTAYEAEKALELQSLRSRNESRAEALQDTVETFTRQKQSQIERLAQGSTSAVRAQSDLEIRKRMEQDRLYRSLAYFVEPLPTPTNYVSAQIPRPRDIMEIRPQVTENALSLSAIDVTPVERAEPVVATTVEVEVPLQPQTVEVTTSLFMAAAVVSVVEETSAGPTVAILTPTPARDEEERGGDTRPMSQSGLEMALRAAAQEAKNAGWGQTAIVEDGATDTVDALRKLREAQKTDSES